MNYLEPQEYERFEPSPDVPGIAQTVEVFLTETDLTLNMHFWNGRDVQTLNVVFDDHVALSSYEEMHHPLALIEDNHPEIGFGKYPKGAYPILKVVKSSWLSSFSERDWQYGNVVHYKFISQDNIVDVLTGRAPEMSWATPNKALQATANASPE